MEDLILHPDIADPVMTLSDRDMGTLFKALMLYRWKNEEPKDLSAAADMAFYIHSFKNGYGNRSEKRILPETAGKRKTRRQTKEKSRGKQGKEIKLIFLSFL